ncbi:dihydroorotate dehydrogenase electron transfer subunit [Natronobacillus azotifigens]|uniref:Dihydroorotate dehydrogenase B (NAD(+)), electron transfer subunit n=1 Tax=Natronobacillus azotifigens TaxID=472978 RepID=A0A9J6RDG5_9BACI|nr:dihydroorotate dehydrogenase electron transfer subunit [Natronobacillus azotifigens]MCZ0703364.1 dihydroorotate dehydrogenase electron transfer subunit [Natronobacillus azotifigens]
MIKRVLATITSSREIALDTIEMNLAIPEFASFSPIAPGQFVHIQIGSGVAHQLRRPISIADVDYEKQQITIIFKVIGTGTEELRKYRVQDQLDLLVPCGNGYPIEKIDSKKALLIGGGIGVPPLYYLAKKLVDKGVEVTSILGFQTKDHVFYEQAFQALGDCHVVTNDGSYGYQGFVTNVIETVQPTFDTFFSCGPTSMLKAVTNSLVDREGYISLEERMGCGVGACYACVIPSPNEKGFKKICQDGPVFLASEVSL